MSAAVEIPFFLTGGLVAARFGLRTVYAIGLAAMALCSVGYAVVADPFALAIVRGLCGVGFACTLLGSVLTVRSIVPAALQATGQALYQSVSYGLAISVAAIVGGILYGALGEAPLFCISALILFAAIPWSLRTLRHAG